jgi:hypothetical protein
LIHPVGALYVRPYKITVCSTLKGAKLLASVAHPKESSMLTDRPLRLSIPAADLVRARQFYADRLGLTPVSEGEYGVNYRSGGMYFTIVPSESAGTAKYSLMTWLVEDIDLAVSDLRARGVIFEDYDLPILKTVNGIATLGTDRVAWFKDSEGNLLAIAQLAEKL